MKLEEISKCADNSHFERCSLIYCSNPATQTTKKKVVPWDPFFCSYATYFSKIKTPSAVHSRIVTRLLHPCGMCLLTSRSHSYNLFSIHFSHVSHPKMLKWCILTWILGVSMICDLWVLVFFCMRYYWPTSVYSKCLCTQIQGLTLCLKHIYHLNVHFYLCFHFIYILFFSLQSFNCWHVISSSGLFFFFQDVILLMYTHCFAANINFCWIAWQCIFSAWKHLNANTWHLYDDTTHI